MYIVLTSRSYIFLVLLLIAALLLTGCSETAESKMSKAVNAQQEIYALNQPLPVFNWSRDIHTMDQIYIIRNSATRIWCTVTANGTGEPLEDPVACMGFPIPADMSRTNPWQVARYCESSNCGAAAIGQAEPSGIFQSNGTDATYFLEILDDGVVTLRYAEQKIVTYPYPVQRVFNQARAMYEIQRVAGGKATIVINTSVPADKTDKPIGVITPEGIKYF